MTFKEKLQKEHPEFVGPMWISGCHKCPFNYGYEPKDRKPCDRMDCYECWNREIPEPTGFVTNHLCKWVLPVPKEDPDFVKIAKAGLNSIYGKSKIKMPSIKQVIFNDPATIVIWADGEKTVVKCQNGEPYDPEKGLAMAITKRALGNKGNYFDEIKKWTKKYKKKSAKYIWGYKRDSERCLHILTCGACGHTVAIPFSKDIIVPPEWCPSCGSKNGEV